MNDSKNLTEAKHFGGPTVEPTVGRVVWYCPDDEDIKVMNIGGEDFFRADVCAVQLDECFDWRLTLSANDASGVIRCLHGVPMWQGPASECPPGHACWMPYQQAQAAKAIQPDPLGDSRTAIEKALDADIVFESRLEIEMLRERVRELRLKNDAQEFINEKLRAERDEARASAEIRFEERAIARAERAKALPDGLAG